MAYWIRCHSWSSNGTEAFSTLRNRANTHRESMYCYQTLVERIIHHGSNSGSGVRKHYTLYKNATAIPSTFVNIFSTSQFWIFLGNVLLSQLSLISTRMSWSWSPHCSLDCIGQEHSEEPRRKEMYGPGVERQTCLCACVQESIKWGPLLFSFYLIS